MISEVSLALVLLIGAALLDPHADGAPFDRSQIDAHNVVTTRTTLDPRIAKSAGVNQEVQDAFRRLGALSGVESIGLTGLLPLDGPFSNLPVIRRPSR